MRHLLIILLSFASLSYLSACDRMSPPSAEKKGSSQEKLVGELDRMESDVRIAAANKRIEDLERKVGELEATPEKVDLDLLTQRVTALELKADSPSVLDMDTPPPRERSSGSQPTGNALRSNLNSRRTPALPSRLSLPDLETHARLATPAEEKAFAKGK